MNPLEPLPPTISRALQARRGDKVVVLTGAGISAESGIPTFRGKDGYWTVGSQVYRPEEMATLSAFRTMGEEVWRWYLYRRATCRGAVPNLAHDALVDLEAAMGDDFALVTQNVDGLHLRAGHTPSRVCEVHGNIDFMRCSQACTPERFEIPGDTPRPGRDDALPPGSLDHLVCPHCEAPARPHVLWFDEVYDERLYRSTTALHAVDGCDVFIVVGTSGATNLPVQAAQIAAHNGALFIDVNPAPNPFSRLAETLPHGHVLAGPSCRWVPALAGCLMSTM